MRYAESRGHEFDNDAPNAFQYRDYVIRAFNGDVSYDQLIREHIAGDLIDQPRLHPELGFNESILGTGFWFLGEWVHSPVDIRKDESDRFDNMIDVMSKAFLGVTVACARCHDHKFDAISTADYYSLTGFLESSDYRQVRFESIEANRPVAKALAELDSRFQLAITQLLSEQRIQLPSSQPLARPLREYVPVDFSSMEADEYLQDGYLFGEEARRFGTPYIFWDGDQWELRFAERTAAVSDPFWIELESISEKGQANQSVLAKLPRSGRTLRTPTFGLTAGMVACRVRGKGHVAACVDSHRMVAGPLHGETIQTIKPDQQWVQLNLQRYVGHRLHLEFTPAKGSQLEVALVTRGTTPEIRDRIEKHEAKLAAAITRLDGEVKRKLHADSQFRRRLVELVDSWTKERASLQRRIKVRSRLAMAMLDGTGEDGQILIRGNSSNPSAVEPRHFLTALSGGQPMHIEQGSGRLELAQAINSPTNPLTSRVIVNRVWHHLMGRGIVPTTDDFGVLGQRPTHPDLLDYLSARFLANGQNLKQLIRYVMLSRTYQMSGEHETSAVKRDPKNLLWHHRPPKRLEGEVIRDALLVLSGQLDSRQFGEPVPVHLTSFMDGRGRPEESGPLDGNGRRSIYLAVRRNFLSPFMLAFDTPVPFSTMGTRNVSNVPAQALMLMNDPFVVGQVKSWANLSQNSDRSIEARIHWLYEAAYARAPSQAELDFALKFLISESTRRKVPQSNPDLWVDLAHALVNTKEFIFLR